jgi:phosphate/sulfate permease
MSIYGTIGAVLGAATAATVYALAPESELPYDSQALNIMSSYVVAPLASGLAGKILGEIVELAITRKPEEIREKINSIDDIPDKE